MNSLQRWWSNFLEQNSVANMRKKKIEDTEREIFLHELAAEDHKATVKMLKKRLARLKQGD